MRVWWENQWDLLWMLIIHMFLNMKLIKFLASQFPKLVIKFRLLLKFSLPWQSQILCHQSCEKVIKSCGKLGRNFKCRRSSRQEKIPQLFNQIFPFSLFLRKKWFWRVRNETLAGHDFKATSNDRSMASIEAWINRHAYTHTKIYHNFLSISKKGFTAVTTATHLRFNRVEIDKVDTWINVNIADMMDDE